MENKKLQFELENPDGTKSRYWISKAELDVLEEFRRNPTEFKLKREEKDSYYYVNLSNSDDTIHTSGMKSRKTGKIYLCKGYEVDLTQPLEESDFHFVRDSTSFDL